MKSTTGSVSCFGWNRFVVTPFLVAFSKSFSFNLVTFGLKVFFTFVVAKFPEVRSYCF
jgi:hypothetical protein